MATDAESVFTRFFEHNTWGNMESASGGGSSLHATRHVRRELQALLADMGVRSMLDIPCGDFHWMGQMDLAGIDYVGADLVRPLIERNNQQRARPGVRFAVLDLVKDELPRCDLVLCRDCLFHLPIAMIWEALANIRRSQSRWLLVTSFSWRAAGPNVDVALGGWRRLNMEMAPFFFPPPLRTINEGFDPEMTQDKSLLLYDVSSIPPGPV